MAELAMANSVVTAPIVSATKIDRPFRSEPGLGRRHVERPRQSADSVALPGRTGLVEGHPPATTAGVAVTCVAWKSRGEFGRRTGTDSRFESGGELDQRCLVPLLAHEGDADRETE